MITPSEKAREFAPMKEALENLKDVPRKSWIDFNSESLEAKILAIPSREDLDDVQIEEQLIIEYYSR